MGEKTKQVVGQELGIRSVPLNERHYKSSDMFIVTAGMGMIISQIFSGGCLSPALGWKEAILASILGSIVGYSILAVIGIVSQKTGLPGLVLFRPSLGTKGAALASIFNNIQLVYWGTIHLFITGLAANSILKAMTGFDNLALWIIVSGVLITCSAVYGNKAIKWLERICVPMLLLLMIFIIFLVFKKYDFTTVVNTPGKGGLNWIRGFDIIFAAALTFAIMAGDVSRYVVDLTKQKNGYLLFAISLIAGSTIGTILFQGVGITVFTATGIQMNPVDVLIKIGLGYVGISAVLLAAFTTDVMILYGIIMGTQNFFEKGLSIKNQRISGILYGLAMTIAAIAFPNLLFSIQGALTIMGIALAPMLGVLIADFFFVRKQNYEVKRMYGDQGSYPSLNYLGIISWIVGIIVYFIVTKYAPTIGGTWFTFVFVIIFYAVFANKFRVTAS